MLFFLIIGLFNICDKLLVAIEILVHWRELFKRGVPLTVAIESSLESWKKCGLVLQHIRLKHCNVNFESRFFYVLDICLALLQISTMFILYVFIFIYCQLQFRNIVWWHRRVCNISLNGQDTYNKNTFVYFSEKWRVFISYHQPNWDP